MLTQEYPQCAGRISSKRELEREIAGARLLYLHIKRGPKYLLLFSPVFSPEAKWDGPRLGLLDITPHGEQGSCGKARENYAARVDAN